MKKRFLSIFLCTAMLAMLLPTAAFATDVANNQAGITLAELAADNVMGVNYGTITNNNGTVTNNGTAARRNGTITNNYGTITNNYGTVTTNQGVVTDNYGIVINNNNGTVTNNGLQHSNGLVIGGMVANNEGFWYNPTNEAANVVKFTVTGNGSYTLDATIQRTNVYKEYDGNHYIAKGDPLSITAKTSGDIKSVTISENGGTVTGSGDSWTVTDIAEGAVITVTPAATVDDGGDMVITVPNPTLNILDGPVYLSTYNNSATGLWKYSRDNKNWTYYEGTLTITGGDSPMAVPTTNTISVLHGSHTIKLKNVSIDVLADDNACAFDIKADAGNVTVQLAGENSLKSSIDCAGLQKNSPDTASLTITSSDGDGSVNGTLNAASTSGAGIGGCGGIGGGAAVDEDGIVTFGGYGNNITISGGVVTATSSSGAGIGGGYKCYGSNITISGGVVTATSSSGAGIGGGDGNGGYGNNITISGGVVTATSASGAGIGMGSTCNSTQSNNKITPASGCTANAWHGTSAANKEQFVTAAAGSTDITNDTSHYMEVTFAAIGQTHIHIWSPDWTKSTTHHWHECTTANCPVTNNAEKGGYGVHNTSGFGGSCSVCGYTPILIVGTMYNVTVTASPMAGGTVTGDGIFGKNTECMVTATPKKGFHFVGWTENGTQISTGASYPFVLTANRNLVAVFQADVPTPTLTVATPSFQPTGGTYTSSQRVIISCATEGADIHYTTNGAEPTINSPIYSTAISVSATSTIKAKAFMSGMAASETATATYRIAQAPKRYTIIKGENGEWRKNSLAGLKFIINADYIQFTNSGSVSVDNLVLASNNYGDQRGSTIITLKASYLETLSVGRHTLRVNFADGYTETSFTVKAADSGTSPQTGDTSNMALWFGLLFVSCGALTILGITKKAEKSTHNK